MRKWIASGLFAAALLGCAAAVSAPADAPERTAAALQPSMVASAQAKSAFALLQRLGAEKGRPATGNLAVSPASLASAFALLDWGADATMRKAMLEVLGLGSNASPADDFAGLRAARATWTGAGSSIRSADKLVLDPAADRYPVSVAGLDKLGAEASIEDLSKPEAITRINDWAKEATAGLIPQVLDAPLDKPAFVALNALHFKGQWQTGFDPAKTKPARFVGADGEAAEVAMMHLPLAHLSFRTDGDFVGVELPFKEDRFSVVVVTTRAKPAGLAAFEKVASWLGGEGFAQRPGELALPRMTLAGREDLLAALDAMGLATGRKAPTALGGFGLGSTVSRILQRTVLEVNEEGAEAATVTAVVGTRSFPPEAAVAMTVDKPFVYALRDRQTGFVVLAGYVGHAPSGKS